MANDDWSIEKALATYNTEYWGEGYFELNSAGRLEVSIEKEGQRYKGEIKQLLEKVKAAGLRWPVLIR